MNFSKLAEDTFLKNFTRTSHNWIIYKNGRVQERDSLRPEKIEGLDFTFKSDAKDEFLKTFKVEKEIENEYSVRLKEKTDNSELRKMDLKQALEKISLNTLGSDSHRSASVPRKAK